ncbi:phosphoribosyltransferase [Spirosoma foliorum]|uniref:Phosphoribosyltransferase n=1 Tax=Spirosoma foliorum TaxID=2710596 RepID=A0A7G5GTT6_9BACT|nr:phosphoribosyltransferase [Spirosoma foliorum]QMW02278.1 phosphoribosyltransferase [Spirosoma foliorum]
MQNATQISPLNYATVANYSPKGNSKVSRDSRDACFRLKNGNAEALRRFANYLKGQFEGTDIFNDFFGDNVVLVPVPRSSLLVAGGLWPSKLIADELVDVGLAGRVEPYLERVHPIKKSSISSPGNRPTVEDQYKSLFVRELEVVPPERITLIDDVLTKGRTSFACALRLAEAFPDTPIRVFASIRTQGLTHDITQFIELAIGDITFDGNADVNRHP